mmetsp:Transcript_19607/g.36243  ORF Transcript_19607/g.36243 Transcript_19607/m.36243 type:complete len:329 (-) Transcript_19607:19-1005(-)
MLGTSTTMRSEPSLQSPPMASSPRLNWMHRSSRYTTEEGSTKVKSVCSLATSRYKVMKTPRPPMETTTSARTAPDTTPPTPARTNTSLALEATSLLSAPQLLFASKASRLSAWGRSTSSDATRFTSTSWEKAALPRMSRIAPFTTLSSAVSRYTVPTAPRCPTMWLSMPLVTATTSRMAQKRKTPCRSTLQPTSTSLATPRTPATSSSMTSRPTRTSSTRQTPLLPATTSATRTTGCSETLLLVATLDTRSPSLTCLSATCETPESCHRSAPCSSSTATRATRRDTGGVAQAVYTSVVTCLKTRTTTTSSSTTQDVTNQPAKPVVATA